MSAGTERYPAPSVEYPVGRSNSLAVALLLVHAGSLVVLWAWGLQGCGAQHLALVPSLLIWLASAVLAARFWAQQPVGALVWDGANWQLRKAGGTPALQTLGGAVAVQLDVQRQLVLVFPGASPAVWLLVEQKRQRERWLDLRRAVYSRPNAASPAFAGTQRKGEAS
ncbi:MAG: hypothetical protein ACTS8S_14090 [Giesbergeria sp.]